MPITPPETHSDNEHTIENKIRICHVHAFEEDSQPNASDAVTTLNDTFNKLNQKKISHEQAVELIDAISTEVFKLEETKAAFAEAVAAIKNYTVD
jgi:hypothetical protein